MRIKDRLTPQDRKAIESLPGLDLLSEQEQKLYPLLVPAYKKEAIDPREFDKVDPQEIKKDLDYVEQEEQRINESDKKLDNYRLKFLRRGELLEAICWLGINNDEWLGTETTSVVSSRYDDIKHGVDQVVEIKPDGAKIALNCCIDVTSSARSVEDKFRQIKRTIDSGHLTIIKYYIPDPSADKRIKGYPRVVLGVDEKTIREISLLELDFVITGNMKDKEFRSTKIPHLRELLSKHWIQIMLLLELEMQLSVFSDYANSLNEKIFAIKFDHLRMYVTRALEEKYAMMNLSAENKDNLLKRIKSDRVFQSIQENVAGFFTLGTNWEEF